jgi:hypothetical protein
MNDQNYFPILFKKECDICNRKFRLEKCYYFAIYRTIASQAYSIADDIFTVCKNCADSKQQAIDKLRELKYNI